jgi:hypothetical protein
MLYLNCIECVINKNVVAESNERIFYLIPTNYRYESGNRVKINFVALSCG